MKKQNRFYLGIMIIALYLSACSASAADPAGEEGNEAAPGAIENGGEESSPEFDERLLEAEVGLQMQLSVGTFVLEDTKMAVTSEQAAELLPLWKAVRSLTESDTTARVEIDAVILQIEDAMTTEQLAFITETELSMEDMSALMEKFGVVPQGAQAGNMAGAPGGSPGGGPGMGMGMGMGPGGGGMLSGDIDPEMQATMEARQAEMGESFGVRMGALWIEPLIELLAERAGG
jgi:hypothetical protein